MLHVTATSQFLKLDNACENVIYRVSNNELEDMWNKKALTQQNLNNPGGFPNKLTKTIKIPSKNNRYKGQNFNLSPSGYKVEVLSARLGRIFVFVFVFVFIIFPLILIGYNILGYGNSQYP